MEYEYIVKDIIHLLPFLSVAVILLLIVMLVNCILSIKYFYDKKVSMSMICFVVNMCLFVVMTNIINVSVKLEFIEELHKFADTHINLLVFGATPICIINLIFLALTFIKKQKIIATLSFFLVIILSAQIVNNRNSFSKIDKDVTCDAGYESEENYTFFESKETELN